MSHLKKDQKACSSIRSKKIQVGVAWFGFSQDVFFERAGTVSRHRRDERAEKPECRRARRARQACLRKPNQDRTPFRKTKVHKFTRFRVLKKSVQEHKMKKVTKSQGHYVTRQREIKNVSEQVTRAQGHRIKKVAKSQVKERSKTLAHKK